MISTSDNLQARYLLFLADTTEYGNAKTALGLRDWAGDRCVGELVLPGAAVSTGLPCLSAREAVAQGADAFRIYDGPSEVHRWSIAKDIMRPFLTTTEKAQ